MNEMYDMSIVTHNWGVMAVFSVIFINIFMLFGIRGLVKYRRAMLLFTPIVGTTIGMVIFSGVVMMASKHLDFTLQNIVMIFFSIILIFLEVKRSKALEKMDKKDPNAWQGYKSYAMKIFVAQIVGLLSISLWMWL
jgi:hypothetical protein